MRNIRIIFAVATMLIGMSVTQAQQLTVAEQTGNDSTDYAPIYASYLDYGMCVEFYYPEDWLTEMVGGTISALTFYTTAGPAISQTGNTGYFWNLTLPGTVDVYIAATEVSAVSTASWILPDDATQVYSGTLQIEDGEMTIDFEEPFYYEGGDIAIRTYAAGCGTWHSARFLAHTMSENCVVYSNTYSMSAGGYVVPSSPSSSNAKLPQCTFTYTTDGSAICYRPKSLSVTDITTEGATLSWHTVAGESNSWKVYADGEEVAVVSDSTYTFTGLSSASAHTLGVSAVCGSEVSNIAIASFRTLCGVPQLPWSDGFEDYATNNTNPDCWTMLQQYVGSSTYPYVATTSHAGSKSLYSYYSCQFATPQFEAEPNSLHVTFWAYTSSSSSALEVGLMTDTADESTWRSMITINDGSSTWKEYEFYTDEVNLTGNPYIVFKYTSSGYYGSAMYVDDVTVEASSSCRRPVSPSISMISYDGATVNWIDNGSGATNYVVRCATSNNVEAADAVDNTFGSAPAVVTGLQGNTTYYAWVATLCGSEQTQWKYCGTFTTQQDCYPVQGLEVIDVSTTKAAVRWSYPDGNGREATGANVRVVNLGAATPDTTDAEFTSGSGYIFTGLEPASSYRVLVSTVCDEYAAYSTMTADFETGACGRVKGSTTSTSVPMYSSYSGGYGFCESIYPASALEGLNEIEGVQFRVTSSPSGGYNRIVDIYIGQTTLTALDSSDGNWLKPENMTLVASNAIINVSSTGWRSVSFDEPWSWDGESNVVVAVHNKSGETSSVTWGATYGETTGRSIYWYSGSPVTITAPGYTYNKSNYLPDITFVGECDAAGCAAPIAIVVGSTETTATIEWTAGGAETAWTVEYRAYGNDDWTTAVATTSATTYTLTGLTNSTLYEVRVGSLCGGENQYSATLQARTACGTITLPYTETFEGWTGSYPFPTCWYKPLSSGSYPYVYNGTSSAHSGSGCMYAYTYSGYIDALIASPEVPTDADNIKVTFWAYGATPSNGGLKAGIVTNPMDQNSFQECIVSATGATQGSYTEYEFYTDNVVATGHVHVAFKYNHTTSTTYIDDVTIREAGNCRRANMPSVNNVGFYSAMLHWNDVNNGAATYQVCYSTENDLETATMYPITTNEDSIEIVGLHNGTMYYCWVRPTCSTQDEDWLPMPPFSTEISCYPVQNVRLEGVTYTTAALSWDYNVSQGMSAMGAVIDLYDMSDMSLVQSGLETTNTGYVFTGLAAGHIYRAYISTVCDPDTASALQYTFVTTQMSCGDVQGTQVSDNVPFRGYYRYSYTQSIYPRSLFGSMTTVSGLSYRITTAATSYLDRTIDVYMGYTTLDTLSLNNYVDIDDLTLVLEDGVMSVGQIGWSSITFDTPFQLDATNEGNVVIAVVNKTGQYGSMSWGGHSTSEGNAVYWYRDGSTEMNPHNASTYVSADYKGTTRILPDISIAGDCEPVMVCSAPVMIITGTTTSTVSLEWAADVNTGFVVEYRKTTESAWTEAATGVSGPTYTVTGLDASTGYAFRVGALCTSTQYSGEQQCYTDCDAVDAPQVYTFDEELSPCWYMTNSYVGRNKGAYYEAQNKLGFSNISTSNAGRAVLPEISNPINTLKVTLHAKYSYNYGNGYNIAIGAGNNQGGNVTWLDTVTLTSSFASYTSYLSNYTGTENHIVITNLSNNYVYIDTIAVEVAESCLPMTSFACSGTTSATATFVWSHSTATNFELEYKSSGDATWQTANFAGNTGTINGLTASSVYQARVRAKCSDEDYSVWSATVSFNTACAAVDMPWTETFDAISSMDDLMCWERYSGQFDDATGTAPLSSLSYAWKYVNDESMEGSKHIAVNIYGDNYRWIVGPEVNINSSNAVLEFDIALTAFSSHTSAPSVSNASDDRFVVLATSDGGATWTPLLMWGSDMTRDDYAFTDLSTTVEHYSVSLAQFNGQSVRIGLYGESTLSGADNDLHIDNVSINGSGTPVEPIDCEQPTISSLTATQTTATLYFSGSASGYEVAIVQGSWVAPTTGTAVTGTTYTFEGLTASTMYTVGVRAVCGNTKSTWATQGVTTSAPADPTCEVPAGVSVSNITTNSARATWTAAADENAWQLEVSGGGNTNLFNVTEQPAFDMMGLMPNTTYTVRVRAVCSSTSMSEWSASEMFVTQQQQGIESVGDIAVRLYPNPASKMVTIEVAEPAEVTVIDMSGRELMRKKIETTEKIDISMLQVGTYFVHCVTDEGTSVSKLVVK